MVGGEGIPCKECVLLAMCISSYKCECGIVDKYIEDQCLDPLYPFHPRSLVKYDRILSDIKRTIKKGVSIRNCREITFLDGRPINDKM